MIECIECKALNLENRHFCGQCGIKMGFPCPQCHFVNLSGEHFCGGCGISFSAPPAPKNFIRETVSDQVSDVKSAKKKGSFSNQAIQEILNIQKGSAEKNKQGKDEKKQVSQDEIESLIHKGLEKGSDS